MYSQFWPGIADEHLAGGGLVLQPSCLDAKILLLAQLHELPVLEIKDHKLKKNVTVYPIIADQDPGTRILDPMLFDPLDPI